MQFRLAALLMMLVLALTPQLMAGSKREPKSMVSFHLEADATDNPRLISKPQTIGGKETYFRRTAEITTKDLEAFTPFPSDTGGDDYGVVFTLNSRAAKRLAAITNANQGRWIISQVNGRIVDGLLIDKPVEDGRLVIWKGVSLADIHGLDKDVPRHGKKPK